MGSNASTHEWDNNGSASSSAQHPPDVEVDLDSESERSADSGQHHPASDVTDSVSSADSDVNSPFEAFNSDEDSHGEQHQSEIGGRFYELHERDPGISVERDAGPSNDCERHSATRRGYSRRRRRIRLEGDGDEGGRRYRRSSHQLLYRYLVRYPWESSQYILKKMVSVIKKPLFMTLPNSSILTSSSGVHQGLRPPSKRRTNSRRSRRHHHHHDHHHHPINSLNLQRHPTPQASPQSERSFQSYGETSEGLFNRSSPYPLRRFEEPEFRVYHYSEDNPDYYSHRLVVSRTRMSRNTEDFLYPTDSEEESDPRSVSSSADDDDSTLSLDDVSESLSKGLGKAMSLGAGARKSEHVVRVESKNIVDYVLTRQVGLVDTKRETCKFNEPSAFALKKMAESGLWKEHRVQMERDIDKIFASEWLNDRLIVIGTKCNKILVYDTRIRSFENIPSLERPPPSSIFEDPNSEFLLKRSGKQRNHSNQQFASSGPSSAAAQQRDDVRPNSTGPSSALEGGGPAQENGSTASTSLGAATAQHPGDGDGPASTQLGQQQFDIPRETFAELFLTYYLLRQRVAEARLPPGGVHAVRINASGSFLATSGALSTDVAVYELPSFTPLFLGVGAHEDLIFDIAWISDRVFVSGSRDSTIAAWRITSKDVDALRQQQEFLASFEDEKQHEQTVALYSRKRAKKSGAVGDQGGLLGHRVRMPLLTQNVAEGDRVRALALNPNYPELGGLTMNAFMHVFDGETLRQKYSRKLNHVVENVCLTVNASKDFYAVGSKSHVTYIDGRTVAPVREVRSPTFGTGVRSLSFNDNIMTLGTGMGRVFFYDVRAKDFLDFPLSETRQYAALNLSPCGPNYAAADPEIVQPINVEGILPGLGPDQHHSAAYTHCYDSTGTRIFVGGGPLQAGVRGCYAAIWQ